MKSNILEVAIETPKDGNVYFSCAGITLRGRKDFQRLARHQPDAMALYNDYPRGVPGTIVRIDLTEGSVTLVEPLRQDEWTPEREKIEAAGLAIPQDREFPHANLGDWLHEIKRSLDSGYAKVIAGELPRDLGVESKRAPSGEDKSEDRIDRLCNLVETLLTKLVGAK